MIEDKETGSLMAENEEEAIWWEQAENAKHYIKQLKGSIKKSQADLKLNQREVFQKFQKGAKAAIKQRKTQLKVQQAFLKFCQEKMEDAC